MRGYIQTRDLDAWAEEVETCMCVGVVVTTDGLGLGFLGYAVGGRVGLFKVTEKITDDAPTL